jgi:hypothetical protein
MRRTLTAKPAGSVDIDTRVEAADRGSASTHLDGYGRAVLRKRVDGHRRAAPGRICGVHPAVPRHLLNRLDKRGWRSTSRTPASEVRAQLAATHGRLADLIQSAPEHQFVGETRFRHRLRLDTYHHYPLHAEAIRQWRGWMSNEAA